eukprot:NODE_1723_length_863_cov_107.995086_g1355_i0.p1 GENE.NODE_1723_length_863_cov_107.995086_g1355_i0~~NODE_1723_length_863_cov_107.995086_g1355_i0.p1  ORF type:complete len:241 (-),score=72.83 NODE_1723_length_863_cov_107.995086_g1355_i0:141-776(-)
MLHLLSILIILWKILRQRGCAGLAFKSQLLYAVVFSTRYLDFYFTLHSANLTMFKLFFLLSSYYILFLLRVRFRASYDALGDSFSVWALIVPCAIVSVIVQFYTTKHWGSWHNVLIDVCWVFSEFLESVAILPQLFMLQKTGSSETLTVHYLAALGGYRVFYVANWIYRYKVEHSKNWISWVQGTIQTLLDTDFFYNYFKMIIWKKVEVLV